MVEIKIKMTFWEWFCTICQKNDIELDTPIVNEMINGKIVTVTPRQFYAWYEDTGDDAKSLFTIISTRHDDDGTLLEFWAKYIVRCYEFGEPINPADMDKGC